jgi:hypothetical protein
MIRSSVEEFSLPGQLPKATTLGELQQDITTTAAVANCRRGPEDSPDVPLSAELNPLFSD